MIPLLQRLRALRCSYQWQVVHDQSGVRKASLQESAFSIAAHRVQIAAWMLEDLFDESIGTATRFVYYHFRAGAGNKIASLMFTQVFIQVVQRQYGITSMTVELAATPLTIGLEELSIRTPKVCLPSGRSHQCCGYCRCRLDYK